MTDEQLIILGAGPCGLAAGLELAGHGLRPLLVERNEEVGGLCRTFHHGPYRVDLSIHRLQFEQGGLPPRLANLFAGELHHVKRKTIHIGLEGRRLPYPLKLSSLAQLPAGRLSKAVAQYLRLKLAPGAGVAPGEQSYRGWFEERLGPELWDWITGPLMDKQWGIPGEQLSASLGTTRRFSVSWADMLSEIPLLGRLFSRAIPVDFLYGREGIGRLMNLLCGWLTGQGGRLQLGRTPSQLVRRGGRISEVRFRDGGCDGGRLSVERLVSTIPLPDLVELLRPRPPAPILEKARALRFRDMMVVAVILDRDRVSRDHVTYYPERRFPFSRTFESKNASPYMAPPGKTVLGFEVPCAGGGELWQADDEQLVSMMTAFGPEVGFDPAEARGGFVFRVPDAYPLYELGHRERADHVLAWLHSELENLFVVGRNGLFSMDNMNHALTQGFDLGRHLSQNMSPQTWQRLLGRYANFSYID